MSISDTIRLDILDDKQHIHFQGRLDTATCQHIHTRIMEILDQTDQPIVFDLGKVDFVASAFLRLCILSARKVGPEHFFLVNVPPTVDKVFRISGLDRHLQIS